MGGRWRLSLPLRTPQMSRCASHPCFVGRSSRPCCPVSSLPPWNKSAALPFLSMPSPASATPLLRWQGLTLANPSSATRTRTNTGESWRPLGWRLYFVPRSVTPTRCEIWVVWCKKTKQQPQNVRASRMRAARLFEQMSVKAANVCYGAGVSAGM